MCTCFFSPPLNMSNCSRFLMLFYLLWPSFFPAQPRSPHNSNIVQLSRYTRVGERLKTTGAKEHKKKKREKRTIEWNVCVLPTHESTNIQRIPSHGSLKRRYSVEDRKLLRDRQCQRKERRCIGMTCQRSCRRGATRLSCAPASRRVSRWLPLSCNPRGTMQDNAPEKDLTFLQSTKRC